MNTQDTFGNTKTKKKEPNYKYTSTSRSANFNKTSRTKKEEEKAEEAKKIPITQLDFYKPTKNAYKKERILTPRSIGALRTTGIQVQDLYFVSLEEFRNTHPETIVMSKEDIDRRYQFLENQRMQRLEKVLNIRDKIINEEEKMNKSKYNKTGNNFNYTNNQEGMMDTKNNMGSQYKTYKESEQGDNMYEEGEEYQGEDYEEGQYYQEEQMIEPQEEEGNDENDLIDKKTMKKIDIMKKKNEKAVSYQVNEKLKEDLKVQEYKAIKIQQEEARKNNPNMMQNLDAMTSKKAQSSQVLYDPNPNKKYSLADERALAIQKLKRRQKLAEHNLKLEEIRLFNKEENLKNKIQNKELKTYNVLKRKYQLHHDKVMAAREREIKMENEVRQKKLIDEEERYRLYLLIQDKKKASEEYFRFQKLKSDMRAQKIKEIEKQKEEDNAKLDAIFRRGVNNKTVKRVNSAFPNYGKVKVVTDAYLEGLKGIDEKYNKDKNKDNEKKKNSRKETANQNINCKTEANYNNTTEEECRSTQERGKFKIDASQKRIMSGNSRRSNQSGYKKFDTYSPQNRNYQIEKVDDYGREDEVEKEENYKVINKVHNEPNYEEQNDEENQRKEKEEEKSKKGDNKEEDMIQMKVCEYRRKLEDKFLDMLEEEKRKESIRQDKLDGTKDMEKRKKMEIEFGKERTMVQIRLKRENEKIEEKVCRYEASLRGKNKK